MIKLRVFDMGGTHRVAITFCSEADAKLMIKGLRLAAKQFRRKKSETDFVTLHIPVLDQRMVRAHSH